MQKHKFRDAMIVLVLLVSLFYIYPTAGWMTLSDQQREARLEKWREEDRVYERPSFVRDNLRRIKRWAEFDREQVINLGLDLQGGIHMVLGLNMDAVDQKQIQERLDVGMTMNDITAEFQQTALRTIERRINEFEAKEPVIQAYGRDQIQIQLPGEKDIERAKRLILKTAYLTFNIVAGNDETEEVFAAIGRAYPKQFLPYLRPSGAGEPLQFNIEHFETIRDVVRQATEAGLVPEDKVVLFSKRPNPWDSVKRYQLYLLDKEPLMTGEGLTQAVARQDPQSLDGSYHIMFELNAASGRRFGEVTEANTGRNMAIVVDNVVESAPVIREKISNSGVISGRFSMEESRDLAIALSSGSMPAPIREDFTGVVGASLGADSVRKGVFSAMVGMILVVIFMIAYYRTAGVIANIALLFNAITIVAVMAYFNATLTLPGIAGLILTIGMAVDANVLIYERIREEIRNGRSILASIDNGFARARITILDANVTTLIAAAVLMQFGTGPIEGFAVTLSIGVVTSVFSALVVSRAVFDFLAARGLLGKLTMTSIFKAETKVGFLEKRRIAGMLSLAVIAIGVIVFGVRQANPPGMFGVDFTTGTNMVVNLHGDTRVDVGSVRNELINVGYADAIVQRYDQGDDTDLNRFMIRIPLVETAPTDGEAAPGAVVAESDTVSSKVQQALEALAVPSAEAGIAPVELEQVETVGPAVGKQLLVDAISAIIYSMIFIVIYLWFRFELKFALGAVVALVHDVLITLAVFALLQRQISLNVVAALLTIIGYSLNDTIVVFDRIREDMRLYRGRSLSYLEIMNLSINQTLSRTILTSATTLIVVLVLFLFGGPVINDFALALLTGVIVGTYSSIFIASPVAYYIQKFQGRNAAATAADTKNQSGRRRRRRSSDSTPEAPAES